MVGASDSNPLGALLRSHRERRGLDVATLALLAGVSESLISPCEQARRNLGQANALKIAAVLTLSEPELDEFMVAREATKRMLSKISAPDPDVEARLERVELAVMVLLRQAKDSGVDLPPELDPPILWRDSSHPDARRRPEGTAG